MMKLLSSIYNKILNYGFGVSKSKLICTAVLCSNVPANLRQYYADLLMLNLILERRL